MQILLILYFRGIPDSGETCHWDVPVIQRMRSVEEYRQSIPASPTTINEFIFMEPTGSPDYFG